MDKFSNYENIKNTMDARRMVDDELPEFDKLSCAKKVSRIRTQIKHYISARNLASKYYKLEEKNSYEKYHKLRIQNEAFELLSSTRAVKFLNRLSPEEFEAFVLHLKGEYDKTIFQKDKDKLMETYTYLCSACVFCDTATDLMSEEVSNLREECVCILNKAMGVEENESERTN